MNDIIEINGNTYTHIIDNFYMGADDYCYILKEYVTRTKRDSNEVYQADVNIGYYTTIQSLVKALCTLMCRRGVSEGKIKELNDSIIFFKEFEFKLKNMLDNR